MTYFPWIITALSIALSIYLWRKPNMDIATLTAKLAIATAAADGAAAKIAADATTIADKDAQIAALSANQLDPAALKPIADGLDAITAKLSV